MCGPGVSLTLEVRVTLKTNSSHGDIFWLLSKTLEEWWVVTNFVELDRNEKLLFDLISIKYYIFSLFPGTRF